MSALTQTLIKEIEQAPEGIQGEILDFVLFVKSRHSVPAEGREDLLPLAAAAWTADWDTPAEDEAWRNL